MPTFTEWANLSTSPTVTAFQMMGSGTTATAYFVANGLIGKYDSINGFTSIYSDSANSTNYLPNPTGIAMISTSPVSLYFITSTSLVYFSNGQITQIFSNASNNYSSITLASSQIYVGNIAGKSISIWSDMNDLTPRSANQNLSFNQIFSTEIIEFLESTMYEGAASIETIYQLQLATQSGVAVVIVNLSYREVVITMGVNRSYIRIYYFNMNDFNNKELIPISQNITNLAVDSANLLYIGCTDGTIFTFDTTNASLTSLTTPFTSSVLLGVANYLYVYQPSDKKIWKSSDAVCFNEGTKICCLNNDLVEVYVPIEQLKRGDVVKTYKHGYRKIDLIGKATMINNPTDKKSSMYKLQKNDHNGLIEDLIITGWHSVMVDKLTEQEQEEQLALGFNQSVDDKQLLLAHVSKDFKQIEGKEIFTYYHFVVENNGDDDNDRYGVYANGLLVETPSKNLFLCHCDVEKLHLIKS